MGILLLASASLLAIYFSSRRERQGDQGKLTHILGYGGMVLAGIAAGWAFSELSL